VNSARPPAPARRFLPAPLAALAAAALSGAIAGCSADDATGSAVPSPAGRAAEACRTLHRALPERVAGLERTETGPASKFTAGWGDPVVELRCGVSRPGTLTSGSEHYNPMPDLAEVNGVTWLLEKQDEGYRFTTTERVAYVEVTVPDAYAPEIGLLTDLAGTVKDAVPQSGE
jgi:hypothetical protein